VKILRDEWHVLTGGYVLDALPGPQREAFERHLHRCASCQTEVRGLRETAARLALAAAVEPPARMEQRVLAATYRTWQLPPCHLADRVRPRRRPRLRVAAAAAGVAAAIAFGVTGSLTQHQVEGTRTRYAAITEVLVAPDARVQTMRTTVGGTVTVVTSRAEREAVVITTGMPSLSTAQVYQLWVMGPAGARSAGLLSRMDQAGPVLAAGVVTGDRIGITIEPAGGTSSPTTTPIIAIPVPA
jgi:anti-sigma factor RsiW